MARLSPTHTGRGSDSNPANRFEPLCFEPDPSGDEESPSPATEFFRASAKSVLSHNSSLDVGFDVSLNPYQGCEHGCPYCYARPTHEYWGLSAGLDFERKISVKENAPDLLRAEISRANWKPQPIALSGVTDCYQPVERRLGITRRCLEVLHEFRNPAIIITKGAAIARDIDLLAEMAKWGGIAVNISVGTLRADLARAMEPRAATPAKRLEIIGALSDGGVPVGSLVSPIVPALNDEEIPAVVEAIAGAGAQWASSITLRLPHGVKTIFGGWLRRTCPDRAERVLNRVRAMHGGRLYDSTPGVRMHGQGAYADQIRDLFEISCRRHGLTRARPTLNRDTFRVPGPEQLDFFPTPD